jgi:GAF domain-containing protein
MELELARLVVRHRHVAPMLSSLLSGTNAAVRITAADGALILEREGAGIGSERFPISVDGETIGWVEGDRTGRAVAAVLSYAYAREADKRSLAREALDRYRELNLVYELADALSGLLEVDAVVEAALAEVNRIPGGGVGFVLLGGSVGGGLTAPDRVPPGPISAVGSGEGILGAIAAGADAEIVNDVAADGRARGDERSVASFIAAPLRAREESIGVIGAATTEPHEFRASDLKVLSAIAALTGPAIDQARVREAAVRAGVR